MGAIQKRERKKKRKKKVEGQVEKRRKFSSFLLVGHDFIEHSLPNVVAWSRPLTYFLFSAPFFFYFGRILKREINEK